MHLSFWRILRTKLKLWKPKLITKLSLSVYAYMHMIRSIYYVYIIIFFHQCHCHWHQSWPPPPPPPPPISTATTTFTSIRKLVDHWARRIKWTQVRSSRLLEDRASIYFAFICELHRIVLTAVFKQYSFLKFVI